MATKFSNALHMSNTAAADFQAWCTFIHQLLTVTGGWVQTADTGQFNPATAAAPTLSSQKVGYCVYRMNDALQATAPVFVRIDYGSALNLANPNIWLTIGTGSDGAGNITGVLFQQTGTSGVQTGAASTTASNSYGSADVGRFHFMLFVRANASDIMLCSLSRAKDSTGADVGTGLQLTFTSTNAGVDTTQFLNTTPGTQPPAEAGVSGVLANSATSAFNANVGVGMIIHMAGIAQQPSAGVVFVNSGDFVAEAQFQMSVYGATRTYQLGNSPTSQLMLSTGNGVKTARGSTRVGIRYD